MSVGRQDVAGFRLAGRVWADDLGTWSSAVTPGGQPGGVLRFEPGLVTDAAARERLVAAVLTDRGLARDGLTGLLPVADLVTAQGEVWLLTAAPAGPTVGDLLSGVPGSDGPGADGAAAVLMETARTLLAVHAAGLTHGELHPGNVVIAADGSALLAKRGLTDALFGRPPAPERDVAAWASLARGLAATWAAGEPQTAALFERVAATASLHGLATARDTLLSGLDRQPPGLTGHAGLAETVRLWSAYATPGAANPAASPPAWANPTVSTPARTSPAASASGWTSPAASTPSGRDEGEVVTMLRVPAAGEPRAEDVALRFGPGVPPDTTAAQVWRAGRGQQETELAGDRLRRAAARPPSLSPARRRGRTALSAVILSLMVVAGVAVWLFRDPAASLEVTKVDARAPKKTQGCDTTVKITGVFSTNGSAGEIRYRWRRSDREEPIEQSDRIPPGTTSHRVTLEWTVKGEGSFRGTATLELVSPLPVGKKLQDRTSFTYRCS
ncbi:hypothetical protein FHS43_002425 [Streptosporangium becharense]|uniref:Uncharacterized protein n=1 Tax=Streptosporangium becharense TaxID=1816182 RepID=A0A7W9IJC1_9ACTN|nr:hypothetical protein [Streptosporangium becharense]MBB2911160.1 hypothetical protein [Streptosporangium becharense]MBB5821782.1 hypothetical protein [Streptosporangium becharense]